MCDIVSIIVPIYNVAPYVDECIRSVCNQTYPHTEILLVDDGSTDESAPLCDNWAKKDPRIKVIHKKNGGLSDARNAGLDVATGKYVLFVDGDDTIEPNLLETALPYMLEDVNAVSFGYHLRFLSRDSQEVLFASRAFERKTDGDIFDFICGTLFRHLSPWSVWSHLYHREFIEKYHLRFVDTKKIGAEDILFNLCFYAHAKKTITIRSCLYNYLQRDGSLMDETRTSKKTDMDRKNNLSKELLTHFKQWPDCAHFIKHFPIIHYLILERNLRETRNRFSPSLRKFRETVLADAALSDLEYFNQQLRNFNSVKLELKHTYNALQIAEKAGCCRFLLKGHSISYAVLSTVRIWRDRLLQK